MLPLNSQRFRIVTLQFAVLIQIVTNHVFFGKIFCLINGIMVTILSLYDKIYLDKKEIGRVLWVN